MTQEVSSTIKIEEYTLIKILSHVKTIKMERVGRVLIAKPVDIDSGKSMSMLMPYKKQLIQFRKPNILKRYMGKTIKLYRRAINTEKDELFCIEPVNFEFITNATPYFTASRLVIPMDYVNNNFDERAHSLRACFNVTTEQDIKSGLLIVFVTEEKEVISTPFNQRGQCLMSRMITCITGIINKHKMKIENFVYDRLELRQEYKYGIMFFKYEDRDDG